MKKHLIIGYLLVSLLALLVPIRSTLPDGLEATLQDYAPSGALLMPLTTISDYLPLAVENQTLLAILEAWIGITIVYVVSVLAALAIMKLQGRFGN